MGKAHVRYCVLVVKLVVSVVLVMVMGIVVMLVMMVVFVSVTGTVFVVESVVMVVNVTAQSMLVMDFSGCAVLLTWARRGGDNNGARGVTGGLGIGCRRNRLVLGFENGSLTYL